jgi:hypothetical protein
VTVNVADARLVVGVITIERTERTLAPVSVHTIFRIGKVRRIVPVVRTGKVVAPVNVDSVGTTIV